MQLHLFPCGSPLTELSDFHPSVRSGNECEKTLKKTRAKGNDIISNVVFANQYFALTFSMLIFKFQRPSSKLSFFFLPCCQSTPKSLLACYHVSYQSPMGEDPRETTKVQHIIIIKSLRSYLAACKESLIRQPRVSGFYYRASEFCSQLARLAIEIF